MELIIKDGISSVLDALGAKLKNTRPIAEAAGLAVVSLTVRAFNDPSVRAAPWAPLAPETIAEKLRAGMASSILKRSTLLWRSWRVIEATNSGVRVGSDRLYAAFQQFGTKRGLPARPMLPILGDAGSAQLTPLAVSRVSSAATAALKSLLGK